MTAATRRSSSYSYEAFREKNILTTSFPTVPTDAYRQGNFASALTGRVVSGTKTDPNGLLAMDGQIFDPFSESIAPDGRRVRLPFAGNQLPQNSKYLDPSAQKVLALIPHANVGGPNQLVNNYNNPFPTDRKTPIPSLKIDHSLHQQGQNLRLLVDHRDGGAVLPALVRIAGFAAPHRAHSRHLHRVAHRAPQLRLHTDADHAAPLGRGISA